MQPVSFRLHLREKIRISLRQFLTDDRRALSKTARRAILGKKNSKVKVAAKRFLSLRKGFRQQRA